jgi:hypothetical protein
MARHAVIKDNTVVNVIIWDGVTQIFQNNPEITLLPNDNNIYQTGMYYENGEWKTPLVEVDPDPEIEEKEALNIILGRE